MNTSIQKRGLIPLSVNLLVALSAVLAVIPTTFAATGEGRSSIRQCDTSGVLPEFGPPGARTHRLAQDANCRPVGAGPSPCGNRARLVDYGQPGLRTHRIVIATGCGSR